MRCVKPRRDQRGYIINPFRFSSAATDPHFANVVLLALNDNGPDAGTTFTDQSNSAHTLTAVGNFQWDDAQAPTGLSTSARCDGSGDQLIASASSDFKFGTGDFALEIWMRGSALATDDQIFSCRDAGGGLAIVMVSSTKIGLFNGSSVIITQSDTIANDVWYHIAWTRSGSTNTLWVGGESKGTATDAKDYSSDRPMQIGSRYDNNFGTDGWFAAARITKGVPRYTESFTPPTLPLPTS